MQRTSARVIAALIALLTLSNSLMTILLPESQVATTQLTPESVTGWSTFRVAVGAPFLMSGLFAAFAALRARKDALVPIVVFFACVVFARFVGLVAEGGDPRVFQMTTLAVVILAAASGAHFLFGKAEEAHA